MKWLARISGTAAFSAALLAIKAEAAVLPNYPPVPPANPWADLRWHLEWSVRSDNLSSMLLVALLLVILTCLTAFVVYRKKFGTSKGFISNIVSLVHPHAMNSALFVLFFATSSLVAMSSAPLAQWSRVNLAWVDFYIPNLMASVIVWYLLASVVGKLKPLYLLVALVVVLSLLGLVLYLGQRTSAITKAEQDSISAPPVISWLRGIRFINECEAQFEGVDPYIALKDGRVVILMDPPGYDAMMEAAQKASPKCGLIPVYPN